MRRNPLGDIVAREWVKTEQMRSNVRLDAWVVMPNHLHGIIVLHAGPEIRHPERRVPLRSPSQTIGTIVRGFKAAATRQINVHRDAPGVTVWQRNYYERIVRSDCELGQIRVSIATNPSRWGDDTLNPINDPPV